jgi:hypothetical protein
VIEYVELRLYTDAAATNYVLLPKFSGITFDVKYNDVGAIQFDYPLADAKALGIVDQSLVGVVLGFTNGTSREVERYYVNTTSDQKVVDGTRMKTLQGVATLKSLGDACVYPSNWIRQAATLWTRASNNVTLTIGAHTFGVGSKVFITGVPNEPTVNGEQTLTSVTGTTITFSNVGSNVGSTALSDAWVTQSAPSGHEFVLNTPGTIFRTLIDRAQARGALVNIVETSFSGTNDSNSAVWAHTHSQLYATGTSYYAILSEFMERGYIDAWMDGWDLRIVNGGTRGSHIGIGTLELRPAQNVTEMTTSTQSEESASTVLIEGEVGTAVERHNAAAQTLLGRRRERFVSQGGIRDAGILSILADAELTVYGRVPTEETIGISPGMLTPFLDFDIADWVWVRYETDEAPVERRVRQLAVSVDASRTITLGVTLNTILYESDVALQRQMDAYTGGGGTYGSQPNTVPDNTTPNAPAITGVSGNTYIDSKGFYRAAFSVSWNAPSTNVDGTAVSDLQFYEVQYAYASGSDTEWKPILRTAETETSLGYSPVEAGRLMNIRVRAVDNDGHRSLWATTTYTVTADTTAPNVPSAPVATDAIGHVDVKWDGKDNGNVPITVVDFSHVEVWQDSSGPSFTPGVSATSEMVGTLTGPGVISVKGGLEMQDMYFKLVSVDKANNKSAGSVSDSAKVLYSVVTDPGVAPSASPTPTVIGGVGVLHVRWEALPSTYQQRYEVHVSTTPNFTPDITTLAGETDATVLTIRNTRANYLMNGSHEDLPLLFTPTSGSVTQDFNDGVSPSGVVAASGLATIKWTPGGTGAGGLVYDNNVPITAGKKVRIAARVQTPAGSMNCNVAILWYNASDVNFSTSTSSNVSSSTSSMTNIELLAQAPVGATYFKYRVNYLSVTNGVPVYGDLFLAVAEDATEPLQYDTEYYVKIVAKVNSLTGPASAQASDSLFRISNEEISANYVYAGTVSAENIVGTNLYADLSIVGALRTGSVVLDPSGLNIPLNNGGLISLPSDGSAALFKKVEISATALTVENNLKISGSNNSINGKLYLESTIQPPSNGPAFVSAPPIAADMVSMPAGTVPASTYAGMHDDGTSWLTAAFTPNAGLYKHNKTTGALTLVLASLTSKINSLAPGTISSMIGCCGLIQVGTDYFTLSLVTKVPSGGGAAQREYVIHKWNSTFTTLLGTWFSYTTQSIARPPSDLRGAFHYDGTNIQVILPTSGGTTVVIFQLSTSLSSYTPHWYAGIGYAGIRGYYRGNADYGSLRYIIILDNGGETLVRSWNSSFTPQTTENWNPYYRPYGLAYSGGRFWTMCDRTADDDPGFVRYPTNKTSQALVAGSIFYDNVGTTHETTVSPYTYWSRAPRSWFRVTAEPAPGGTGADAPTQVAIYGRSDGIGNTLKRQEILAVGVTSKDFADFDNVTGPDRPLTNSFASVAIPGTFESVELDGNSDPFILLQGTGNAKIGNLIFDPAAPDDMEVTAGPGGTGVFYVENLSVYGDMDFVGAQGSKLVLTDTTDASTAAGNAPALRVGSTAGLHLRIDGNEIIAMTGDSTGGTLGLNDGGPVVMSGRTLNAWNWGTGTVDISPAAAFGTESIAHGLGNNPGFAVCMGLSSVYMSYVSATSSTNVSWGQRHFENVSQTASIPFFWFACR